MSKMINRKTVFSIISICIVLLTISSCYDIEGKASKGSVIMLDNNTEPKPWSFEHAIHIMDEAVHAAYGVQDSNKFNEIIAKKNSGDENALYVYAILLLNYNIASDANMSDKQAQIEGLNILIKLAENKHPQASRYLAENYLDKSGQEFLKNATHIKSNDDFLVKKIYWYHTAINRGERPYSGLADILFFGLNSQNANLLLLSDQSALIDNKNNLKEAISAYTTCAIKGRDEYCGTRLSEAYYWGYGVEKDYIKAHAWAKFITEREHDDSIYRNIGALPEIINKTAKSFDQSSTNKADELYQKLKQDIPPNTIKFADDEDGQPIYVTYTSQWLQERDNP